MYKFKVSIWHWASAVQTGVKAIGLPLSPPAKEAILISLNSIGVSSSFTFDIHVCHPESHKFVKSRVFIGLK